VAMEKPIAHHHVKESICACLNHIMRIDSLTNHFLALGEAHPFKTLKYKYALGGVFYKDFRHCDTLKSREIRFYFSDVVGFNSKIEFIQNRSKEFFDDSRRIEGAHLFNILLQQLG